MAYQVSSVNISFTANANKMTTALNKLNTSLTNVNKTARDTRSAFTGVSNIFGSLTKTGATKAVSGLTKAMGGLAKAGLMALGIKSSVSFISDSIRIASDYTETLNKMSVALDDDSDALERVTNLAQRYEDILGISKGEFLDYQSGFASMAKGYGVANNDIEKMSQNLSQLAYDYASLFNQDVSVAFTKLNSAMSGQSKGLKAYGNVVDNAALKDKARELGLSTQISTLDKATQAYLRYSVIMENASKQGVFGDTTRTLGTMANQMRILEARVTTLKRSLGDIGGVILRAFIGPVSTALAYVNYLITAVKNLFGIKSEGLDFVINDGEGFGFEDAVDDTETLSDNLGSASQKVKELKKHLQGFDEINLIPKQDTDSSSGSSGSGAIGSGIDPSMFDIGKWDDLYNFLGDRTESDLQEVFDRINNVLKEHASAVIATVSGIGFFRVFSKAYEPVVSLLSNVIGPAFDSFGFRILGMGDAITKAIPVITGITAVALALDSFAYALGSSDKLAEQFNNVLQRILKFTADFRDKGVELGREITEKADNFFKTALEGIKRIDFNAIGQSLSNGLIGALDMLANIDYGKIFADITNTIIAWFGGLLDVIQGMDWRKIGNSLGDLISNIFSSMISFIKNLDYNNLFNTMFKALSASFTFITDSLYGIGESIVRNIYNGIKGLVSDAYSWLKTNLVTPIVKAGKTVLTDMAEDMKALGSKIVKFIYDGIKDMLGGITGIATWLKANVFDPFNKAWDKIKQTFGIDVKTSETGEESAKKFKVSWDKLKPEVITDVSTSESGASVFTKFKSGFESKGGIYTTINGSDGGFWDQGNRARGWFGSGWDNNKLYTTINGADGGFTQQGKNAATWFKNGFAAVGGPTVGIGYSVKAEGGLFKNGKWQDITKYASGGLPDYGQMFIAREAGPELVGRIGSNTAVVNNDQIVSSVASGVARAVQAVLGNGNNNNRITINVVSELDGRRVGESVVEYNNGIVNRTGRSPFKF